MNKPEFTIHQVNWPDEQQAIRSIRTEVFIQEQMVPPELEWDGLDEACIHLLARNKQQQPIATTRLLETGQIGRMAVLKEYRGLGIGTALLQKLLEIAIKMKLPSVFLNSQLHAIEFYQRFGFVKTGSEFNDAGIPHCRMQKDLAKDR